MTEPIKRPEIVTDEHLEYLDMLKQSGETNMLGAGAYLMMAFERINTEEARTILVYWMESYGERHQD